MLRLWDSLVVIIISSAFCLLTQVAVGQGPPWMQGQPPGGEQRPGGRRSPFGGGMGGMERPPFGGGQEGRSFGGGRDRQRPDGGTNSSQNDGDRNQRRIEMLKSMDTNKNGTLEPSEIPEYRRQFVERIVAPFGISTNSPINLKSIEGRILSAPTQQPQSGDSSANQSSRNNAQPPVEPLVPPFGEKQETQLPVLSFGQKETKTPVGAAQIAAPLVSADQQTLRAAQSMMTQYDKNKNGTLDKDKGEWNSALPFKPDSADKNKDGRISMSEMLAAMGGGGATASLGASVVAVRQSNAYDHLPEGTPDWFFEADTDQDGQITLQEYANGPVWRGKPMSKELILEFESIDRNNDGLATAAEVFATLKEHDEKKAREADQKQREEARRGIKISQPPAAVAENKDAPNQPNNAAPPASASATNAAAPQTQGNVPAASGSPSSGSSRSYNQNPGSSGQGQGYQRSSRRSR